MSRSPRFVNKKQGFIFLFFLRLLKVVDNLIFPFKFDVISARIFVDTWLVVDGGVCVGDELSGGSPAGAQGLGRPQCSG